MKIETHETAAPFPEMRFAAIDSNTYDGAPDSGNRDQIGYGKTPDEAINDLVAKLVEQEGEDSYAQARKECGAAAAILDHLQSSAQFYMEIDEPDGTVKLEDGEFVVTRRDLRSQHYPVIGRFASIREALELAVKPLTEQERKAMAEDDQEAA